MMKLTTEEINQYRAAASLGLIPDEENPIFLFGQINKELLLEIIEGRIDCIEMAKIEMRNRGLDLSTGRWIGWKEANC